jgi:enoyl-CoA hydratase/carnithine racemase
MTTQPFLATAVATAPATDPDSTVGGPPTLDIDGPVATVRLCRPARRNSLDDADLRTLLDHVARVDADPAVRVLLLAARTDGQRRPVFCAGYHVGGFDAAGHDPRFFEQVPEALARARPVTVCALGGSVYGGATDLVLACDLRVALAGTEWRMPANALGLHYYPSGLQRYVAALGVAATKRAFLTARALPIERLDALGLFETLAPDAAAFDGAVHSLVADVAALAPLSTQATKRSLDEIARGAPDEPAMRERERLTEASADFAEGRLAFAERRAARFSGR